MATFNRDKADKDALASIETLEVERLKTFKVCIKHKDLANKPEDEDDLVDEDGKPNGPKDLAEELQVQKNFKCLLCKNIPIAPVVQCTTCETLYCGQQCLEEYKKQIALNKAEMEAERAKEEAAKAEAAAKEAAEAEKEKAEADGEKKEDEPEKKEDDKEADAKVEEVPKQDAEEAPKADEEPKAEEKLSKKDRRKKRGATKKILPEKACCLNKKCKNKGEIQTQPLGRIIRNIMCTFEFEHETGTLTYEALIKQQKADFKEKQVYRCPLGCDTEAPLSLTKEEMKEHIINDCPFLTLQCNECTYEYKRCDFENPEKHDCIKNLLEQLTSCNKKIVEMKAQVEDEAKVNVERRKGIEELEKKQKELNDKYNKMCLQRQKLESQNYDWFGSRHTYQNQSRMPMKLPKNFVNTVENIKDSKLIDGPVFVDLARKKKGASWTTSVTVELQFKRKIAFNAYSLQFWQGEPPKVEEEKVEEKPDEKKEEGEKKEGEKKEGEEGQIAEQPAAEQEPEVEEHRPGNNSYMYIYVFNMANGKSQQIGYQHFNQAPKEQKPVKDHVVKWRDCGAVMTDRVNLRFDLYNDKNREQFEKLLVTDFNFYY